MASDPEHLLSSVDFPQQVEKLSPEQQELLDPAKTAIIVIDVQNGYFSSESEYVKWTGAGTTQAEAAARGIKQFLQAARKYNPAAIVFTRMEENKDVMHPNLVEKMKRDGTPDITRRGEWSYEYFDTEISPQEGEYEVEKVSYPAFVDPVGEDLHRFLQSKGVTRLIVVGGYASVCVNHTANDAIHRLGYTVFAVPDLIANLDGPEKPDPDFVDEKKAFLQELTRIGGEAAASQAILHTWQQVAGDSQTAS